MPMDKRVHVVKLLNWLRLHRDGSCAGGITRDNCMVCPCSTANSGPCRTSPNALDYRARKLKILLAYMQANDMQDIIDANVWMHAAMRDLHNDSCDSDAYYAALPL